MARLPNVGRASAPSGSRACRSSSRRPRTGSYRAGERLELKGFPKVSRADVADFVLRQLNDRTFLKKGAVISG